MEEDLTAWKTDREGKEIITIKEKFSYAIKRGSGEAHLIMKKYPTTDFSSEILRSVINTYAFDAQSEGTREKYYYDLIQLSNNKETLIEKIVNLLKKKRRDTWAIEQLFNLCALFARDGNAIAGTAVYEQYLKKKVGDTPWVGEDAIVCMDKYKGVSYLAEYYGKRAEEDPEVYVSTGFLYYYDEKQRSKIIDKLKKDSAKNFYIKRFLKEYYKELRRNISYNPKLDYKGIKSKILSDKPLFITPKYRRKISRSLISKIAIDFMNEPDINIKKKYLRFFGIIKFPFSYKYILNDVKTIETNANLQIEFAVDALKFFRNSEIREFAISKLITSKFSKYYLDLLVNNYQEGDADVVYDIVKKQDTPDKVHSIVWSIVEIYYKNRTKECKKNLEFLYNHLACGAHRYDVVKIMKMNNVLSERIRREIKYDSYLTTRKLA